MNQITTINGLKVHYKNKNELDALVREIFDDSIYDFDSSVLAPLILDCGAHIGLSVLYFKTRYPEAEVIAFEPNPVNFELLKQNVKSNNLSKVICLPVGVADFSGNSVMFGHFGAADGTLGNSIMSSWGKRQDGSSLEVQVIRLSNLIGRQPIEFLKLDVEGMEWPVIHDIQHHLNLINHFFVEIHSTNQNFTELEAIKGLFAKQNFSEKTISHKALSEFLNGTDNWIEDNKPVITQIIFKKEYTA
ncbi:FkbM family methyltransferase [Dyadobacter sp. CY347]|uniref:FkbM family methyltransferase n=1 Tax=Dyadobacter sp. CY347 TaxID=2909336 RepID=UPI001F02867C|nr:FkbM family methyltransferase [Dyadobacter sp. CY347]MCF2487525.1 FkbM family methyltransferase [Dyadobacter sp. CY347]